MLFAPLAFMIDLYLSIASRIMLKKFIPIVLFPILFLAACGSEQLSTSSAIYDSLDIRLIHQHERKENIWAQSVGALVYGTAELIQSLENTSNCTGVAISQSLVVTAGHCLQREPFAYVFNPLKIADDQGVSKGLTLDVPEQGSVGLKYEGALIPEAESFIQNPNWLTLVYRDSQRDFAVYRSQAPLASSVRPLDIFAEVQSEGELALYGFPKGVPLSLSSECRGIAGKSGVDVWHDCDSLGGSSGSLLVNTQEGKPVGLHHLGGGMNRAAFYKEKGRFETPEEVAAEKELFWKTYAQDLDWQRAQSFWNCKSPQESLEPDFSCAIARGLNRAILFSEIRERLRAHAPELYEELRSAGTP